MSAACRHRSSRSSAGAESGGAGRSAHREYERRRAARRARLRARYGALGAMVAALAGEPRNISVWEQGAMGEAETALQLEAHLRRCTVALLHDRRLPGRGRANIDHLAVGPAGLTVIDSKSSRGRVTIGSVGLVRRREVLLVNGWDRTAELDRLERHLCAISETLDHRGVDAGDVLGGLCFPYMCRPWLHTSRARGGLIVVDDPRHIARVARRPGPLSSDDIAALTRAIAELFPPATR